MAASPAVCPLSTHSGRPGAIAEPRPTGDRHFGAGTGILGCALETGTCDRGSRFVCGAPGCVERRARLAEQWPCDYRQQLGLGAVGLKRTAESVQERGRTGFHPKRRLVCLRAGRERVASRILPARFLMRLDHILDWFPVALLQAGMGRILPRRRLGHRQRALPFGQTIGTLAPAFRPNPPSELDPLRTLGGNTLTVHRTAIGGPP